MDKSIIQDLGIQMNNHLYIKRDDLLPYSFGGNKARKANFFFEAIDAGNYDTVVTYGSSHSNHCRVVANMAAERGLKCVLIGPKEVSGETFNSRMMKLFGGEIVTAPVTQVHDTIGRILDNLKSKGHQSYFIPGGGHGNLGTQAYVECYEEIRNFGIPFDYLFFASGTGTTQAGLICGKLKYNDPVKIIGISIARSKPYGRQVVLDSIQEYMGKDVRAQEATIFIDDYISGGYGKENFRIVDTIIEILIRHGIPLDSTYTGKAFFGMQQYIQKNGISSKNILFLHTGGTPLFFDDLDTMGRGKE